ncbi:zinc finger protein PLAGL1-like isoform X3 [Eriocheir sinensis]|uniref:zinc finger protein PLAGL1-like isoform X3 n=1 Tax=Eriocheir sinensis TaxID=95602 RepID=UPI0021C7E2DC|nr:zinc finger protein PLAGL1-like isoform X3 [Eriocheir sinensis]XP_050724159.1 zinc finger protein PLAGL1-like isoform X3 [Eriocheir sinensis]
MVLNSLRPSSAGHEHLRDQSLVFSLQEIPAQCELKVWYSKDYAERMGTRILAEEGVSWQFRTRQRFRCRGCEVVFSSAASLTNHRCVRTSETPKSEASSSRGRQGKKGRRLSEEAVAPVPSTSGKKTVVRKGSQQQQQQSGKPVSKLKVELDSSEESSDIELFNLPPQRRSPRSSPRGRGSVYSCDICKKVFLSPGKLKQHSYSHTGERPFSCVLCHKAFSSRFKLVRHQLIHTTERQHQCPRCERSFHRKDHLKNHIQIHEPNKQFKCEKADCGKEYNSYMSYRKHCAVHAAEEGDLQCKICQKMFETKPDLIYHLKVHVGSRSVKSPSEKKFQCDHCDRRFFTRKDVKRHLVVHTGKRDFSCTICPQKFGRKDHLVRHIKKSHGIADLSRMEGLEFSATHSSAPQALSPNVSVASSPPSASGTHPLPMVILPEPVAGPSGLSGSAGLSGASGLLDQGESQFITPFQQDLRLFEETVKEEPELQPSMEEIGPEGDDLSKILGMYLPSGSINLPGPSLLDPSSSRSDEGESQRSHLESVMLRLAQEEHKESVLQSFPQESVGPREEYGQESLMSASLMPGESSGMSTRPLHSPGQVSQLSGSSVPVVSPSTTTTAAAATPAASSVPITTATSQFPSLPGFDEVFPS